MILLVSTCQEPLHELEFVKPIERILKSKGYECVIEHYTNLKSLERATHIIICGTSLKDDRFLHDLEKFTWVNDVRVPLLGICAGMQIIGLLFGLSTPP